MDIEPFESVLINLHDIENYTVFIFLKIHRLKVLIITFLVKADYSELIDVYLKNFVVHVGLGFSYAV